MHVWVNMSVVGDTTPAKMKARRMKTRRLAFSMAAVTSPRRDRTRRTRGQFEAQGERQEKGDEKR